MTRKSELFNEAKNLNLSFDKKFNKLTILEIEEAIAKAKTVTRPDEDERTITPRDGGEFSETDLGLGARSVHDEDERAITSRHGGEPSETEIVHVIPTGSEDLVGDLKEVPDCDKSGKFRVSAQRFLLTYKTHLDKELVKRVFEDKNVKEAIVAHEKASSATNYEHSHVFVDFGKAFQSRNVRIFDIENIHPNIKVIKSKDHLTNVWSYMCKEDKENEFLLERLSVKSLFEIITEKETIAEAMKLAQRPGDFIGIKAAYGMKPSESQRKVVEPTYKWQMDLIAELTQHRADDRTIIWYYDPQGGNGKSTVTKWLESQHGAAMLNSINNRKDGGDSIRGLIAEGWDSKILLCNFPRSMSQAAQFYDTLECIKDGQITSEKNSFARVRLMHETHIVVFANFFPLVHQLTADRWRIRQLSRDDEDNISVTRVNLSDMRRECDVDAKFRKLQKSFLNDVKDPISDDKAFYRQVIRQAQIALEEAERRAC